MPEHLAECRLSPDVGHYRSLIEALGAELDEVRRLQTVLSIGTLLKLSISGYFQPLLLGKYKPLPTTVTFPRPSHTFLQPSPRD